MGSLLRCSWNSLRRSRFLLVPYESLVKSAEKSDGINRGTPASTAALTRLVCSPTITSLSPDTAETTQDPPLHEFASSAISLKSTSVTVTRCSRNLGISGLMHPVLTMPFTVAPFSRRWYAILRPSEPVMPAMMMVLLSGLVIFNLSFLHLNTLNHHLTTSSSYHLLSPPHHLTNSPPSSCGFDKNYSKYIHDSQFKRIYVINNLGSSITDHLVIINFRTNI